MKWKCWYSVFAGLPNFLLFISTAWLIGPLNKATRDTCDLHNHTSLKQPSRKNLDRKFWKLERVGYLAIETDVDRDNVRWSIGNFNNPPGIWQPHMPGVGELRAKGLRWYGFSRFLLRFCGNFYFKLRYCGFKKPSGLRYLEIFEFLFQSGLRFSHVILCGTAKVHSIMYLAYVPLQGEKCIWRLPGWSEVFELEMWVRWRSVKVKKRLFRRIVVRQGLQK